MTKLTYRPAMDADPETDSGRTVINAALDRVAEAIHEASTGTASNRTASVLQRPTVHRRERCDRVCVSNIDPSLNVVCGREQMTTVSPPQSPTAPRRTAAVSLAEVGRGRPSRPAAFSPVTQAIRGTGFGHLPPLAHLTKPSFEWPVCSDSRKFDKRGAPRLLDGLGAQLHILRDHDIGIANSLDHFIRTRIDHA
ncbi:hypothetical protein F6X37_14160 [Paraburkholderia sp. 31.1]|uniref:hypothetical protein n=1 Tax=Paraburkholderia sp. 31.1 TaxID=2615205 RepID=UPI001655BBE1|nr:hypothetical protein [Paraburkholderia sp. 31.1]MBC8722702.1 hypothetical protein [Paraburkholderia sp. 31.1]